MQAQLARVLVVVIALLASSAVARANEQQQIVDRARITVEALADPRAFPDLPLYIKNAYGLVIVPQLVRGGFILGAQFGVGVLLVRDVQSGAWSDPVFVTLAGGSIGLQIGGETSELLLTLMNEGAVQKILDNNFKLGATVSGALGPVGARMGAGTTLRFGEDVYIFARNMGLFAGVTFEGTVIAPRHDWNERYYGRKVTPKEIIAGKVANRGARALKQALARFR